MVIYREIRPSHVCNAPDVKISPASWHRVGNVSFPADPADRTALPREDISGAFVAAGTQLVAAAKVKDPDMIIASELVVNTVQRVAD